MSRALPETLIIPMIWEMGTEGGGADWTQFPHFVHEETGAFWQRRREGAAGFADNRR